MALISCKDKKGNTSSSSLQGPNRVIEFYKSSGELIENYPMFLSIKQDGNLISYNLIPTDDSDYFLYDLIYDKDIECIISGNDTARLVDSKVFNVEDSLISIKKFNYLGSVVDGEGYIYFHEDYGPIGFKNTAWFNYQIISSQETALDDKLKQDQSGFF